ncbi:O-unit flippase-like protein [uncultured Dysosmobacter sp.]|uniref:O-unit flippase-like protein n=1 Tax=uncultured Dysosmobacter sp. TaxID=2591384 RepID=UPI00263605FF|nr:O-unit flippase-like protein [uncultured Dysosmobacter sp.]
MSVRLNSKDYIWSYIGVFVSVGSGAVMLPFVLHYLSEDMYGLWGVFQSIAAITALFDFGFSTTFARNINYCWCGASELKKTGVVFSENSEPNFPLMKRVLTACRYVFLLLSGIALLCMALPGSIYIGYVCRDIAGWEPMTAWAFYAFAVFLNLYYGYFNSFLRGVGAVSDANRVTVISRLAQIVLTIALLACGFGIVGTGIAYLAYGFIYRILSKRAFLRFRGIGSSLDAVADKPERRELVETFRVVWHNAGKEGLVTLANYLANQACTIISPLYMTLAETGIYSLAVQLATVLSNVSGALYSANQPVLQSAYVSNDKALTRRTMSLIVVSYVLLYIVGLLAIVTVGLPLLRLIKPATTPNVAVMLGVGLYQFLLKFRNCYTSYFSCTNRIPYAKAFLISSGLGVALAAMLLFLGWGVWGLILAQIVSQCMFNVWYWPRKAHREMELSVADTVRYGFEECQQVIKNIFKGVAGREDVE